MPRKARSLQSRTAVGVCNAACKSAAPLILPVSNGIARPSAPPITDRHRASVTIWRMSRVRVAPSDNRNAVLAAPCPRARQQQAGQVRLCTRTIDAARIYQDQQFDARISQEDVLDRERTAPTSRSPSGISEVSPSDPLHLPGYWF